MLTVYERLQLELDTANDKAVEEDATNRHTNATDNRWSVTAAWILHLRGVA